MTIDAMRIAALRKLTPIMDKFSCVARVGQRAGCHSVSKKVCAWTRTRWRDALTSRQSQGLRSVVARMNARDKPAHHQSSMSAAFAHATTGSQAKAICSM
jgi:hypothetical protein